MDKKTLYLTAKGLAALALGHLQLLQLPLHLLCLFEHIGHIAAAHTTLRNSDFHSKSPVFLKIIEVPAQFRLAEHTIHGLYYRPR